MTAPTAEADARRTTAERIMEVFPDWLVMWGAYSRQFWAWPRFDAPAVRAADPGELAGQIRRIQRSAADCRAW